MKTENTILYKSPIVRIYEFENNVVCNASYGLEPLDTEGDEFLD